LPRATRLPARETPWNFDQERERHGGDQSGASWIVLSTMTLLARPASFHFREWSSPLALAVKVLGVAVLYYGAARLGLLLAIEGTNASPVWPPSGIALAAVLLLGYRVWPGIVLGAVLANLVVFMAHAAVDLVTIVAVSSVAVHVGFGGWLLDPNAHFPLTFVPLPWLVWAAFRFGPREAATAATLTSAIAVLNTVSGLGPFSRETVNASLLLLQAFVGVVTVTILTMTALVRERRDAEEKLRKAHDALETDVDRRTRVLWHINERLQVEIAERRQAEAVGEQRRRETEVMGALAQRLTTSLDLDAVLQRVKSPETSSPRGGVETVLVVEDEPEVRALTREMLEDLGYTVLEARRPREALHIAEEHLGPIHLVLTDVVMPELNGRRLAERLTSTRADLKVLFMSGYTDDAIVHHGAGTCLLQKPFSREALADKVREVLDKIQDADERGRSSVDRGRRAGGARLARRVPRPEWLSGPRGRRRRGGRARGAEGGPGPGAARHRHATARRDRGSQGYPRRRARRPGRHDQRQGEPRHRQAGARLRRVRLHREAVRSRPSGRGGCRRGALGGLRRALRCVSS
jgi:CheY-like chemotaxis protein